MAASRDDGRSMGTLLRDLADGSGQLVRHEVQLARVELGTIGARAAQGTVSVAVGSLAAVLGAMAIIAGIILLLGDAWLRDQYWLAALIVTVVLGVAAAWMGVHGARMFERKTLAPDETAETLREDAEWLKRQLTSGATSS